jgi:hypothetical protein
MRTTLSTILAILILSAAPSTAAQQWALAINGDDPSSCTSRSHRRNVDVAVESLEKLGFSSDRIVVLAHPAEDDHDSSWLEPTRSQLRDALDELARKVGPDDTLVVYLTGHGYRMFGRSHLALGNSLVSAKWLSKALGEIRYGRLVIISDQCFSGGMDSEFGDLRESVFVSSASPKQTTSCVAFIRPFWRALVDPKNDVNGDGQVSIEEAFVVASHHAEERAVATRPSDPIYRGLGGQSLKVAARIMPTLIAAVPLAGRAVGERVAVMPASTGSSGSL